MTVKAHISVSVMLDIPSRGYNIKVLSGTKISLVKLKKVSYPYQKFGR